MSRKQIIILILALIFALGVRIYLIPAPGYERDIQLFKIWSQTAATHGVHNVYDKTWCDYPPAYLYVLKVTGQIYRIFQPDFKEQTYLFTFLVKFPAILADLIAGLIIFLFLKRIYSFRTGLFAMTAYVFNPIIIFNSAYWGQVDSVTIFLALLAVIALTREKYCWSWGLLTVAILVKTQMFVLLPIFILITWRKGGFKRLMGGFVVGWLTFVVTVLPFLYFHKVDRVIDRILNAVGEYPSVSMNAFNLWWLLSRGNGIGISDTHFFLNLFNYRTLGTIFFAIFMFLVLKYLFGKENDRSAVMLSCALAFFGFFMLPTEMHERYILPVFIFLLLSSIKDRNLKIIYGILSFFSFFSLPIVLTWAYPKNFSAQILALPSQPASMMIALVNVVVLSYFLYMLLKGVNKKYLAYGAVFALVLFGGLNFSKGRKPVYLSDLAPAKASQQWSKLKIDRTVDKNHLTIQGFKFNKGLGTHAYSEIIYNIDGRYRSLEGYCGLDDEQMKGNKVGFSIYGDQKLLYESGVVMPWQPPRYFSLPIEGVKQLKLIVTDGGDGINCDHADWLNVKLLP